MPNKKELPPLAEPAVHEIILIEPVGANVILHCACGWSSHLAATELQGRTQHEPLMRDEDKAQVEVLRELAYTQPKSRLREPGENGTPIQHQVFLELEAKGLAHLIPQMEKENESANHTPSI